jgi:Tol biopolymer transport system component
MWFDANGRPGATVALPTGRYEYPVLSPDGRRAVVTKLSTPTSGDLWVVDLQRDVPTRLTFDGSVTTGQGGVWSPDGNRIAFQYNVAGPYDIYEVISDGTGRPEPLVRSDVEFKYPAAFSADGRYLAFAQMTEETGIDLWLLPLLGDRAPVPYLRTPFNEVTADISPDGRWLAYCSDETGTAEIYVRSFPEPGEKHRVSTSGGTEVKWSADGRQLLFSGSGTFPFFVGGPMYSVDVQTTPSFKAGNPRVLFTVRRDLAGITATSDLKRFLAAVPVEGATPPGITVVMNWQEVLKR